MTGHMSMALMPVSVAALIMTLQQWPVSEGYNKYQTEHYYPRWRGQSNPYSFFLLLYVMTDVYCSICAAGDPLFRSL